MAPLLTALEMGTRLTELATLRPGSAHVRAERVEAEPDASDHHGPDGDQCERGRRRRGGSEPIRLEIGTDPLVAREEALDPVQPDRVHRPERSGLMIHAPDGSRRRRVEAMIVARGQIEGGVGAALVGASPLRIRQQLGHPIGLALDLQEGPVFDPARPPPLAIAGRHEGVGLGRDRTHAAPQGSREEGVQRGIGLHRLRRLFEIDAGEPGEEEDLGALQGGGQPERGETSRASRDRVPRQDRDQQPERAAPGPRLGPGSGPGLGLGWGSGFGSGRSRAGRMILGRGRHRLFLFFGSAGGLHSR